MISESRKKWLLENKAHLRAYKKAWQSTRIEQKRKSDRERYVRNREQIKQRTANYYANHKNEQIKRSSAYVRKRRQTDLNYLILSRLRCRVNNAVRKQSSDKSKKTIELLGCSISSFRIYIESKFEPGMTWGNIHLDHIVPCVLFDLTKPEHQKRCFHFSNYQPLFAKENDKKGTRLFHKPGHLPL